jgi:hypothetical protein
MIGFARLVDEVEVATTAMFLVVVVRQISRWQICRLTGGNWTCEADATKVSRPLALRNCSDNYATN